MAQKWEHHESMPEDRAKSGSPPILTTKLYPPPTRAGDGIVLRPRLVERLTAGLRTTSLTLISAPAGFGKTTLVSALANQQNGSPQQPEAQQTGPASAAGLPPLNVAWLSLDDDDNEPTRFLAYLIAALQRLNPDIARTAQKMLQSAPPPTEILLTAIINDVSTLFPGTRPILILDDYHLIEAKPTNEALTFLLNHLPPPPDGLHLVIVTRDDPHLPLARLRSRGQLTELRAADLRFTTTEATEFLNRVMGLNLSEEDVAALDARTEGWIAGLQLAAMSLQKQPDTTRFIQSFSGSHRFILDYLVEEVLAQQPAGVQNFLLQTALLNRLTGPLCDALTGQDNGQATLQLLERANLFIVPLDEERRWYRYHHLFADLLRQRQHQNQSEQTPALHRRASAWYEHNGFPDEAIEHALKARDFEPAVRLIKNQIDSVWERGEHTKLRRWLNGLPPETIAATPQLSIFQSWYLLAAGQQDNADRLLQAAQQALDAGHTDPAHRPRPDDPRAAALRGKLATVQAFSAFYRGDIAGIIQHASQALDDLPRQELSWRSTATHVLGDAHDFSGDMEAAHHSRLAALAASRATENSFLEMIASLKLAIVLRQQGQLSQMEEICRQQLQLAQKSGLAQTGVTGWLLAIWGEGLAEENKLEEAVHQAKKGVALAERGSDLAMLGWSYLCLIRVLFSTGNLAAAEALIRKIERVARDSFMPPWIISLKAAWQARIWLARDNQTAAALWVTDRRLTPGQELSYLHEMEMIALARILMAQGRLAEASPLLQRLLEAAEAGQRTARVIEILAVQALCLQAQQQADPAVAALEKALGLAGPAGFIRIFVDEGLPLRRLLNAASARGIAPDYTGQLLAAFPDAPTAPPAPSKATTAAELALKSSVVEPLSERELEVLQLIAAGLTNREISARLFVSPNTVKVHTRNIFGKLDAHDRDQAVARARKLGILLR